jgi:CRISPR/Cas system CMR-associated protein Cmr3 (group 5 of RAMP superfamily)
VTAERWVVLEPLDTLTIRDGRAFDAGLQSVAHAVQPSPSTLAGAIGAAFGAPPGAGLDAAARGSLVPEQLLGPVPVIRRDGVWRARWPVPFDVVRVDAGSAPRRLTRHSPVDGNSEIPVGAAHDLQGRVAILLTGEGDPAGGWWETAELADYLAYGDVSGDTVAAPWDTERRVGLALNEDGTASEGLLYSTEHLRPADGMGFAVCCVGGPSAPLADTVPLGGRGRCAQVHDGVSAPALPSPATRAPDGRLLLYLATPSVFADGWRPDLSSSWAAAELAAAALGDPQVITTAIADRITGAIRGGQLMWAVPAGSVYYLKFGTEAAALEAAAGLRHRTLPQVRDALATAGFGFALTGSW